MRSSLREATAIPGTAIGGSATELVITAPRAIAISNGLTPPTSPAMPSEIAAPRAQNMIPGNGVRRRVRIGGVGETGGDRAIIPS
jgi:hypothetical protein